MGIMVYSLLWVMQDFDHQPYHRLAGGFGGFTILCLFMVLGLRLQLARGFMGLQNPENLLSPRRNLAQRRFRVLGFRVLGWGLGF